jgi:hypothetical protein
LQHYKVGMVERRTKILIILLILSVCGFSQKHRDHSLSCNLFLGGSNLLGDLGGGVSNGTIGIKDIDLRSIKTALGLGISYNKKFVSFTSNITLTRLVGNDKFSKSLSRSIRNLSVRTDILELNVLGEVRPFESIPILKGVYLFSGVGGVFFEPKAELNSQWLKLRPLGTEGQLIDGGKPYGKFTLVIPYGAGYKFPLGEFSSINLEIGIRKSFTDYMDDVSTVYASSASLSETSATLADRSGLSYGEGAMRGDSDEDDNYFLFGLKFQRTIVKKPTGCFFDEVPARNRRRTNKQKRRMLRRQYTSKILKRLF